MTTSVALTNTLKSRASFTKSAKLRRPAMNSLTIWILRFPTLRKKSKKWNQTKITTYRNWHCSSKSLTSYKLAKKRPAITYSKPMNLQCVEIYKLDGREFSTIEKAREHVEN